MFEDSYPGEGFTPIPGSMWYEIRRPDGLCLTPESDSSTRDSWWALTERSYDECTKWEIIFKYHDGQECINIKCEAGKFVLIFETKLFILTSHFLFFLFNFLFVIVNERALWIDIPPSVMYHEHETTVDYTHCFLDI